MSKDSTKTKPHLKDGKFLADMMCTLPWLAGSTLANAAYAAVENKDINQIRLGTNEYIEKIAKSQGIKGAIKDCKCARTDEGMELCLNFSREDMIPGGRWRSSGENPEFDAFIGHLNKAIELVKKDFVIDHTL